MKLDLFVHRRLMDHIGGIPFRPYEVGGWLLGFWADDAHAVFVTHATPPAASHGTPFGVHISGRGHRRRFADAWEASSGAVTYLGDWHTHPGCPPTPSPQDARALSQLASSSKFGTPRPLMAILSTPRWPAASGRIELAFYVREPTGAIAGLQAFPTDELPPEATAVPDWPWPSRRSGNGLVGAARGHRNADARGR